MAVGWGAGFDGGLYQNLIKKETTLSGHLTGGGRTLNPLGAPGGAPGRGPGGSRAEKRLSSTAWVGKPEH